MGQKNKSNITKWLVVALVVALIAFAAISFNLSGDKEVQQENTEAIITATSDSSFCANNPDLDLNARILDTLASSKTYLNGTLLLKNLDTGSVTEQSITGGKASTFTSLSNVLKCTSVAGYEVYLKYDATVNSDNMFEITPDMLKQDPVEITVPASMYSQYKVKCYDNDLKTNCVNKSDNATTWFVGLTTTYVATTTTGFSVNADEIIDVTLTLAPATSSRAKGTGTIIAIDTEDSSNLDDFDESLTLVSWDGVILEEATGLSENELRALNSYEHIYKVDEGIGMDAEGNKKSSAQLRVRLEAESGASAKSFDPVIKIIGTGDYESQKTNDILRDIGFKDDSSRTELVTAQTVTLQVSATAD
ncbi:hypothetical protein ACFL96_13990 [Thermoproteota archaeon]